MGETNTTRVLLVNGLGRLVDAKGVLAWTRVSNTKELTKGNGSTSKTSLANLITRK